MFNMSSIMLTNMFQSSTVLTKQILVRYRYLLINSIFFQRAVIFLCRIVTNDVSFVLVHIKYLHGPKVRKPSYRGCHAPDISWVFSVIDHLQIDPHGVPTISLIIAVLQPRQKVNSGFRIIQG